MAHELNSSPTKRADAERNRIKILAVARAAFAESDTEISMAEISRRAGVGMATLYRNFADRRELLEALYTDEVDAICEATETVRGETPGALTHGGSGSPVFGESRARVLAAGRPLLLAAQQAHEVRNDLTLEQILDMIVAIARIHGAPRYLGPILQSALDGISVDVEPT